MTSRTITLLISMAIALQLFIGFKAMRSAQALLQRHIQQIEAVQ